MLVKHFKIIVPIAAVLIVVVLGLFFYFVGPRHYNFFKKKIISISKSIDSPDGKVVPSIHGFLVGKWDFEAHNEDVKIKSLNVKVDTSNNAYLANARLILDGVQIGSTDNIFVNENNVFKFGSTFIVPAHSKKTLELWASNYPVIEPGTQIVAYIGKSMSADADIDNIELVSGNMVSEPIYDIAANPIVISESSPPEDKNLDISICNEVKEESNYSRLLPCTRVSGQLYDPFGGTMERIVPLFVVYESKAYDQFGRLIVTSDNSYEFSTNNKGRFDFLVPNGKYILAFKLPYNPIDKNKIGVINLDGESKEFNIKLILGETTDYYNEIPGRLDYCSYIDPKFKNRRPNHVCYMVKPGDSLWGIAEKYYGDGSKWKKMEIFTETLRPNFYIDDHTILDDPCNLVPGTKLVLWRQWELVAPLRGDMLDGWGPDYNTNQIYKAMQDTIFIGDGVYDANEDIYDNNLGSMIYFTVDKNTNNKIYITNVDADKECYEESDWATTRIKTGGYRVVFNKKRNTYYSCGWDFKLLTFSPDGNHYAIRNNRGQGLSQLIVLSDTGNGPFYDYSDSLFWYDNDTLIYRAQNNDEWRVVINHKDYAVYDYLENLRLEDGLIKFDARHEDGEWTREEIRF